MKSFNPATSELIWEGAETSEEEIRAKIVAARKAFPTWSSTTIDERISLLKSYAEELRKHQEELAILISKETGKALWDSKGEVSAMIKKIPISIEAYHERCKEKETALEQEKLVTQFRPHGVVAVFGPYNFPGHLPNGHIVPALLAGNCVLLKPSEFTPAVGEKIVQILHSVNFPKGVIDIVQGGPRVGQYLASSQEINGLFFTGSARTGISINETLAKTPQKILALEMGGNNPLIVSQISDLEAAVFCTIQSAFLTTGQRCSCARRLILVKNSKREFFLKKLIETTSRLKIGAYTDEPEPFMGPVIHLQAAKDLLADQANLLQAGAKALLPMKQLNPNLPFVTPAIIDVTAIAKRPDEEYFGPLLQVILVDTLEEAVQEANRTQYGLTAGILSTSLEEWTYFYQNAHAGVINRNASLTGASSQAPFGGLGKSGNHRPSAYLAADYCSYPIASIQAEVLQLPKELFKNKLT